MVVKDYAAFLDKISEEHYGTTNPVTVGPFTGTIKHDIGRTKDGKFFFGGYVEFTNDPFKDPEGEMAIFKDEDTMLTALQNLVALPDNDFDLTQEIVNDLITGYEGL